MAALEEEITVEGRPGAHPPVRDADLLAAVAGGSQPAFRALYDRFAGRLLAYVRRMGGPRVSAEDVVQEIFVSIWVKAGQYRPALGSPEAWIFTITRHKVVDIWRSGNPVVDLGETPMEAVMEPVMPEDSVTRLSLAKALAALAPEQRRPLELAYFGGLSYEETAHALGLPVGTLKSRIRATLGLLRAHLGGAG
ncbi:MAG: RNA polymerase sigma factor [Holophagaceae bacterium]